MKISWTNMSGPNLNACHKNLFLILISILLLSSCNQDNLLLDQPPNTEIETQDIKQDNKLDGLNFEFDRREYLLAVRNSSLYENRDRPLPEVDTLQKIYDMIAYQDDQEEFLSSFIETYGLPEWNYSSVSHITDIEEYYVSIPWSLNDTLTGVFQYLMIGGAPYVRFLTPSATINMMLQTHNSDTTLSHTITAAMDVLYFKNRINQELDTFYLDWLTDIGASTQVSEERGFKCYWYFPDDDCYIVIHQMGGGYDIICNSYEPILICNHWNDPLISFPCGGCSGWPEGDGGWNYDPNYGLGGSGNNNNGSGSGSGGTGSNNNNDDNLDRLNLTQHKALRRALRDLGIDIQFIDEIEPCAEPNGTDITLDVECAYEKLLEEVYNVDIVSTQEIDGVIYGTDSDGILHIYLPPIDMSTASDQQVFDQITTVLYRMQLYFCEGNSYEPIDWRDFFDAIRGASGSSMLWNGTNTASFDFDVSLSPYYIMDTDPAANGSVGGGLWRFAWEMEGTNFQQLGITISETKVDEFIEIILPDC